MDKQVENKQVRCNLWLVPLLMKVMTQLNDARPTWEIPSIPVCQLTHANERFLNRKLFSLMDQNMTGLLSCHHGGHF